MIQKARLLKSALSLSLILASTMAFAGSPDKPAQHADYGHNYFSIFAGGGLSKESNFSQSGTSYISPPLAVNAKGCAMDSPAGMAGVNVGFSWHIFSVGNKTTGWMFVPSTEAEGYYLNNTKQGVAFNNTTRIPGHRFTVVLPMATGVFLANLVINLTHNILTPYIGIGIGGADVSIINASSEQTFIFEPNINHFNSKPNAFCWAFATQTKAGLRILLAKHWSIFGEYRFLYIHNTSFNFGATTYSTHAVTSGWHVKMNGHCYSMGTVGISYIM